jgi:hypothetical protein
LLSRDEVRLAGVDRSFIKLTTPTPLQQRVFNLLELTLRPIAPPTIVVQASRLLWGIAGETPTPQEREKPP